MIYIIQSGTKKDAPIKIGTTSSIRKKRRRGELQVGNPDRLHELARFRGGRKRERELHAMFSSSRRHGEWFNRTTEIKEWLVDIAAELPESEESFWLSFWTPERKMLMFGVSFAIFYLFFLQ